MQIHANAQMILLQRSIDAFVQRQIQDLLIDHYQRRCVLLLH